MKVPNLKWHLNARSEQRVRKMKTQETLCQLASLKSNEIQRLLDAFVSLRRKQPFSSNEQAVLLEIQRIKRRLRFNFSKHTIDDFGAGSFSPDGTSRNRINPTKQISTATLYHYMATNHHWGKVLFQLIRNWQPMMCLELGTSLGIGALYQLGGLKCNGKGDLITIEGASALAKIASENLSALNYPDFQVIQDTFQNALPKVVEIQQNLDFVFIDGHHEGNATKNYFKLLLPALAPHSLIIFDDINWSVDMQQAWLEITKFPSIEASFDLYKWGMCLIDKTRKYAPKPPFYLSV